MTEPVRFAFLALLCGIGVVACRPTDARHQSAAGVRKLPPEAICGSGPAVLTGSGIGALKIGRTVAEIARDCKVIADTTVQDAEGEPQRVLLVRLGNDTVAAEIADGRVWRLGLTGASIRTADSLGIGTRLSQLRRISDLKGAVGEGLFALSDSLCGLSFQLSADPDVEGVPDDLARYPDSTSVTRVLVVGCGKK